MTLIIVFFVNFLKQMKPFLSKLNYLAESPNLMIASYSDVSKDVQLTTVTLFLDGHSFQIVSYSWRLIKPLGAAALITEIMLHLYGVIISWWGTSMQMGNGSICPVFLW